MTRAYALTRLLEHGPLTFAEMVEITGWTLPTVDSTIRRLMRKKIIAPGSISPCTRWVYRLA